MAELLRKINDMFHVDTEGYLVKSSNGERVPEDEPVFILRARDNCAGPAIGVYLEEMYDVGAPQDRIDQIKQVFDRFRAFGVENQQRMKIPGSTHGR